MPAPMIGNYIIKRLLGQGGMGAVYLAEHALLGRPAAVKILLPTVSSEEEIVQRFFDEARATTSINDPGIVQVFDFGYHVDGSAYIVMEYLDGETLDMRLEHEGPLQAIPALRIARQVAMSLHAAHLRGIVHRDLKLENVLLVTDPAVPGGERAKILDFGIAKLSRDEGRHSRTRTGSILGTPIYMSPEQCRGAHDVDGRADIYALGCLLFCLVTGRPPFDYPSNAEVIAAHLKEAAPRASSRAPGLAPEVDEIIANCLAKDPNRRYRSMAELAADITELLTVTDRSITSPPVGRPSSRRRRPTTLSSAIRSPLLKSTSPTAPTVHGPRRGRIAMFGSMSAAVLTLLVAAGATWRRDARALPGPTSDSAQMSETAQGAPMPRAVEVTAARTPMGAGFVPVGLPVADTLSAATALDESATHDEASLDDVTVEPSASSESAERVQVRLVKRTRPVRAGATSSRPASSQVAAPRARRVLPDGPRDVSPTTAPVLRVRDVDRGD